MAKSSEIIQPYITEVPLTAEAREQLIARLFADELPHDGEVFIPDDDFYYGAAPRAKAKHMVGVLCRWLGVKPGYIGLEFESGGGEAPDGSRHTIYVETSVLADEFVLGGFLAYALTRYLIEERKQIHLPAPDQQSALLASSSIVFGLGLVIGNGISPAYSWLSYWLKRRTQLLKDFPLPNYSQMTLNFLRKYRVDQTSYLHALTPWAAKRMGLTSAKRLSHAAADARHQVRVANMKLIGVLWILLLTAGIAVFVSVQRIRPLPARLVEATQKARLLDDLTRACKDRLAYDKQYADMSDIQAIRAIGAEELRCQSLQNQSDAARRQLDSQIN